MKCPKCSYLGFDTGDRCKNCGYDFSLLPDGEIPSSEPEYDVNADLILREAEEPVPQAWPDHFDRPASEPPAPKAPVPAPPSMTLASDPAPVETRAERSPLPLFSKKAPVEDEPLVKLPPAPRPPLAVRRTPDAPRLRPIPKEVPRMKPTPDPVFQFSEEPVSRPSIAPESHRVESTVVERSGRGYSAPPRDELPPSDVARRLWAALIDHGILLGIDLVVLYFTLRMAALTFQDWRVVPVAPMLAFLAMVKFAYFTAFTSVGGQTIGKMATRIRVVADDAGRLDAGRAMQRAVMVLVSLVTLGIGFLPALGSERRAFHDRLARTRVVVLPSA